jgi:hypothetical protein
MAAPAREAFALRAVHQSGQPAVASAQQSLQMTHRGREMDDRYRFFSTLSIWAAYTLVLMTLFIALAATGAALDFVVAMALVAFVLLLTTIAGVSTTSIWRSARDSSRQDALASESAHKGKRTYASRIDRLIEELDEDEIIELESLLMSRQGDDFG